MSVQPIVVTETQVNVPNLTEQQMDEIAERAALKAVEKITQHTYQAVGKSIVNKFFYIIGMCAVGLYYYLQQKGYIK